MENSKKHGRYERIYIQISELIKQSPNMLSRMSTINAVLHHKMDYFFWTGFYLLNQEELTVGPYQGPAACQLLEKNTGVCWAAINQKKTIVVPDVHKFPGYIACDSRSNSEIAVPLINAENKIIGVFDVDSRDFSSFDDEDKEWLEKIVELMVKE